MKISKSPADSKSYGAKKGGSAPCASTGRISTPQSVKAGGVKAKGSAPSGIVDLSKKHSTVADKRNRK
jgi:hypothetical protein